MSVSHLSTTRSRRFLALGEAVFLAILTGCLMVLALALLADPLAALREEPGMLLLASR